MMIQSKTNNHLSFINLSPRDNHCTIGTSTSVENPLQIAPFMQNEPNFKIGEINVSIVLIRNYEKEMAN